MSIILNINATLAIVISASVAVAYTFFGGLYAVAYTDVIQLGFIAVFLVSKPSFNYLKARLTTLKHKHFQLQLDGLIG